MEEIEHISRACIENCLENNVRDWSTIKNTMKSKVSDHIYHNTKRNPMILPVIMEV